MRDVNLVSASPDLVSGYELNPRRGYFSVVLPIERTNLISNPSFETNSTGYTSVGGATLTRTTETQRRGVFSLKIKPGLAQDSGVFYTTSALTRSSDYAFSVDLNIRGGSKYIISVYDGTSTIIRKEIIGKGYWERISITFTAATNGAHRLYVQKNFTSDTREFFTDGWQLELCGSGEVFPTTYIDGDQSGYVVNQVPPAYFWNGTPHASTSVRSGQTRAGGRIVSLLDIGFHVTAFVGLGMSPVNNVATPFGLLGGSIYQRTVSGNRKFSIVGYVAANNHSSVQRMRRSLIDSFKPDLLGTQQPLLIKYQYTDDCGYLTGEEIDIVCNYSAGLEGNSDNLYQERIGIQFIAYNSFSNSTGEVGSSLAFATGFTGQQPGYIIKRGRDGVWSKLSTNQPNGNIQALAEGIDGSVYLGGTFLNLNSVGGTVRVGRYDGTNYFPLASGITGTSVRAIDIGLDGRVYAGGIFTVANPTAVSNIAVYNPNTNSWAALGTGVNDEVRGITVGSDGSIYVVGPFTQAGGLANTRFVARWTPSTGVWSAIGTTTVAGTGLFCVLTGLDGNIYVGGNITSVGGVANTTSIARWNTTLLVWESVSSTCNGSIFAMAVGPDGSIYATGDFTIIGGVSVNRIARYNGVVWTPLGVGMNNQGTALAVDARNNVIVGGNGFNSAGGLKVLDSLAIWNGSSWVFSSIDLVKPTSESILALLVNHSNDLYVGFNNNGVNPSQYSGITSITNNGEGSSSPKITIYGSGTLYQIDNFTTGATIYFNLTLQDGEIAVLDLTPGSISFKSNTRGNILSTVLPGSAIATFFLQPGRNSIGVFIVDGGPNCASYMTWRESQWSIDGGIRR